MKHVVALSGGKDSTAMALRLKEVEPETEFEYICTPTGRELPVMEEHWSLLERLLERPLIRLTNGTLDSWIKEWVALPNFRMRWCTRVLKIQPMMAWLKANQPVTHYVGLRADEESREGIYGDVAAYTRHPLREWGWKLSDVKAYLANRGIKIPARTDCDICFFQRVNEWKALLRQHPDRFAEGEAYEELTGSTFRTPGRDSWPVRLADFRAEVERQPNLFGLDEPEQEESDRCRACSL